MTLSDPDQPRYHAPLDELDPRFDEDGGTTPTARPHERELVASTGPYPDPDSKAARFARYGMPAIALAGLVAVAAVFFAGLGPGSGAVQVGAVEAVRQAVADRPRRVCYEDSLPCAWLTLEKGRLIALNSSGPLPEEFGREGVGWCPSSGGFGSNVTGSRYDAAGRVVSGPAPRGLDRYGISTDDGTVTVDFTFLQTGARAGRAELVPPSGPDCDTIPFDREADLVLPGS